VAGDSAAASAALQRHVDAWEVLADKAFVKSYRKAMTGHASHAADAAALQALTTLFLAEKAIALVSSALSLHASNVGAAMRHLIAVAKR
jgi:maltose alpha-D-glucosyltransferase/alpha-amylase